MADPSRPRTNGKRAASTFSKLSKQSGSLFVPARRGGNIKKGEDPGHEELRKREKVCQVDLSNDFLSHEFGKPTYEERQGKIVSDEKKRGRNDKSRLGGEKMFETRAGGYGCPVDGILLFGSGQFVRQVSLPCAPARRYRSARRSRVSDQRHPGMA